MDEDGKTLLAILALLYGSSNGIGLFKSALDPLKAAAENLKKAVDDLLDSSVITDRRKKLFKALWTPSLLVYLLLVLLPPLFLLIVVLCGAEAALELLGLGVGRGTGTSASATSSGAPFYIILLILALLASVNLLSDYFSAWRAWFTAWLRDWCNGRRSTSA